MAEQIHSKPFAERMVNRRRQRLAEKRKAYQAPPLPREVPPAPSSGGRVFFIGLGLLITTQLLLIVGRASRPVTTTAVAIPTASASESIDAVVSWPVSHNNSNQPEMNSEPPPPPPPKPTGSLTWEEPSNAEQEVPVASDSDSNGELVLVEPSGLNAPQDPDEVSAPVTETGPQPTPADPATEAFAELDFSLEDEPIDDELNLGIPGAGSGSATSGDVPLLPFTREIVSRSDGPLRSSTPADATKWNGTQRWDPLPQNGRGYQPDTPWIEPPDHGIHGNSSTATQSPNMLGTERVTISPQGDRRRPAPNRPFPTRTDSQLTPPMTSYPTAPSWSN